MRKDKVVLFGPDFIIESCRIFKLQKMREDEVCANIVLENIRR